MQWQNLVDSSRPRHGGQLPTFERQSKPRGTNADNKQSVDNSNERANNEKHDGDNDGDDDDDDEDEKQSANESSDSKKKKVIPPGMFAC